MEYAEIGHPPDMRENVDNLVGLGLVDLQVGPGYLDAVLTFDAGDGLFDVVADVLREVEDDARESFLQLLLDMLGQLVFRQAARPLVERLERREELDVEEPGDIGAIIGAAELRDYGLDFTGCSRRMERMRPVYVADCSIEIDMGSVARIQRLPSSSFGMNSRPRKGRERRREKNRERPTAAALARSLSATRHSGA